MVGTAKISEDSDACRLLTFLKIFEVSVTCVALSGAHLTIWYLTVASWPRRRFVRALFLKQPD